MAPVDFGWLGGLDPPLHRPTQRGASGITPSENLRGRDHPSPRTSSYVRDTQRRDTSGETEGSGHRTYSDLTVVTLLGDMKDAQPAKNLYRPSRRAPGPVTEQSCLERGRGTTLYTFVKRVPFSHTGNSPPVPVGLNVISN